MNGSTVNVIYGNGEIYLAFDLQESKDLSITIYSMLGEKIVAEEVKHVQKNKIKLSIDNFPSGIYVAVADMKNAVIARKIIKMF